MEPWGRTTMEVETTHPGGVFRHGAVCGSVWSVLERRRLSELGRRGTGTDGSLSLETGAVRNGDRRCD
jgi:hypothetical protein